MARSKFAQRALAAPLGLALGLAVVAGAIAQEAPEDINTGGQSGETQTDSSNEVVTVVDPAPATIFTNADGADVESTSGSNPVAEGGGGTLIYGDITGGVPAVPIVNSPAPASPGTRPPDPEPAPSEPAPAPAPSGTAPVNPPATSPTDQDGDNIPDADEPALGLDPANIDTDGDFIDDGYELNGLGTDPTNADTDGDGVVDGEEVYGIFTDPLIPNGATGPSTAPAAAPAAQPAAAPASASLPGTTGPISAEEGDVSTLGPGSAEAAPGTINGSPPAVGQAVPGADTSAQPVTTCADYGTWYDAQTGYEAAGRLNAPAGLVDNLDPDRNGIACEALMA